MAEAGPSGAREPEEGDDSSEEDDNVSVFEMSSEAHCSSRTNAASLLLSGVQCSGRARKRTRT